MALLRREWWEHKAGFCWTPLAIAAVLTLLALYLLALAGSGDVDIAFSTTTQSGTDSVRRDFAWNDALLGMLDFSAWSTPQLESALASLLHLVAQPFIYAHFLVALFVLPGTLNDDRRDRSVLFWKSMPVSDLETVASKLVLVVWVAPLMTIAAIVATWVAVLGLVSIFSSTEGAEGVGRLWAHAGLAGKALALLTGYALQGLWTLPVYAWLLLVSAAVPRGPLVWSVLAPLVPVTLERLLLGSNRLWLWISEHLQFVALPRPHAQIDGADPTSAIGLAEQFELLLSLQLWSGIAVGAALIAGAAYSRGRNNDI